MMATGVSLPKSMVEDSSDPFHVPTNKFCRTLLLIMAEDNISYLCIRVSIFIETIPIGKSIFGPILHPNTDNYQCIKKLILKKKEVNSQFSHHLNVISTAFGTITHVINLLSKELKHCLCGRRVCDIYNVVTMGCSIA